MARAAAEGQRVVLVVATDGAAGLAVARHERRPAASPRDGAPSSRSRAAALGVHRLVSLGYADSGLHGDAEQVDGRAGAAVPRAARGVGGERSRRSCVEEDADVLVTYDPNGGYGHPDHVRVHELGVRAAEIAGTPRVFEATVPRDLIAARRSGSRRRSTASRRSSTRRRSSARSRRRPTSPTGSTYAATSTQKRASMAAHASQATADDGDRTLAAFLRMPKPLYRQVFGTEWYVERARRTRHAGEPTRCTVVAIAAASAHASRPSPRSRVADAQYSDN